MNEPSIYSVSQINNYLKRLIEGNKPVQDIWVRGEISNFSKPASGHWYFSLKDERSLMKAVMWKGTNRFVQYTPKDGEKVLIRTSVAVYESQGYYQFNVKEIQPDGVGALHLAFEELKRKLHAEGLFDETVKKPIPSYPKTIGIVTSATGAAVQDMITTIKRRYPIAKILLSPVSVQGEGSAESIADAIRLHNTHGEADVLIVGRGGGSIEDLWAFNEEIVARAIFKSMIPIISAVGHETDFTIADFVADLRAPTPTAAAEHATPYSLSELQEYNQELQLKLFRSLHHRLQRSKDRHDHLHQSLLFRHPRKAWETSSQQLDQTIARLQKSAIQQVKHNSQQFIGMEKRLLVQKPNRLLEEKRNDWQTIHALMIKGMDSLYKSRTNQFEHLIDKLDMLSPLKTMNRGYSIVKKDAFIIKSVKDMKKGDRLSIQLQDGLATSTVDSIEEEVK